MHKFIKLFVIKLKITNSNNDARSSVLIFPAAFFFAAIRNRLKTPGNIIVIRVTVDPPTKSSNTPNRGTVSATKTIATIIPDRVTIRFQPKSANKYTFEKFVQ
jgi:hypothetical protein